MKGISGIALVLLLAGCASGSKVVADTGKPSGSPAHTSASDVPADPNESIYEQMRAGAFQYGSIIDGFGDEIALTLKLKPLAKGDQKDAIENLLSILDSAGGSLEDFQDAPTKESVAQDFKSADDRRLKAIDGGNDALHLIREAQGSLEDLSGLNSSQVNELAKMLDLSEQDLIEAIEAWGGKAEAPDN